MSDVLPEDDLTEEEFWDCRPFTDSLYGSGVRPGAMITVPLPSGGWATVAPDTSPETLLALDRVLMAAVSQVGPTAGPGGPS